MQKLHACSQVPRQCILEWYAEDHDTSAVMPCEIYTLRYLASSDRKKDGTPAVVTGLLIVFQGEHCLQVVLSLNENELVLEHSLQDAHFIPFHNHVLHILVRCEEAHHAIGH